MYTDHDETAEQLKQAILAKLEVSIQETIKKSSGVPPDPKAAWAATPSTTDTGINTSLCYIYGCCSL